MSAYQSAKQKSGKELIRDEKGYIVANMEDFWRWAYSDLMGNAQRGIFAEFLIARAMGESSSTVRIPWNKYDLLMDNKIRIEVKTSGYLQTWKQEGFSKLTFSIAETKGWNYKDNTYDKERKRQADVYVFCVFKHREQESADPLNLSQWDFYVISTKKINDSLGCQKTVGLGKILSLGALQVPYLKLKEAIYREYEEDYE